MSNPTTVESDRSTQINTAVSPPAGAMISRIVWLVFAVIEAIIAIRFVLELLGANAKVGFVTFVYGVSDVFMIPFVAIFKTQRVPGHVLEWSALVAIAIYALVAWGIVALIRAVAPNGRRETTQRVIKDATN